MRACMRSCFLFLLFYFVVVALVLFISDALVGLLACSRYGMHVVVGNELHSRYEKVELIFPGGEQKTLSKGKSKGVRSTSPPLPPATPCELQLPFCCTVLVPCCAVLAASWCEVG